MSFPEDQIEELKQLYLGAARYTEGGRTFFFLPRVNLPDGCDPARTDLLLCPTEMDNYPSRLFLADRVKSKTERNWNASGVRIIERNWHAYSWKVNRPDLRLAQLVSAHLRALR